MDAPTDPESEERNLKYTITVTDHKKKKWISEKTDDELRELATILQEEGHSLPPFSSSVCPSEPSPCKRAELARYFAEVARIDATWNTELVRQYFFPDSTLQIKGHCEESLRARGNSTSTCGALQQKSEQDAQLSDKDGASSSTKVKDKDGTSSFRNIREKFECFANGICCEPDGKYIGDLNELTKEWASSMDKGKNDCLQMETSSIRSKEDSCLGLEDVGIEFLTEGWKGMGSPSVSISEMPPSREKIESKEEAKTPLARWNDPVSALFDHSFTLVSEANAPFSSIGAYVPKKSSCLIRCKDWYNRKIRQPIHHFVDHPDFSAFILMVIFVNALFQALADPTPDSETMAYQEVGDYVFTVVFTLELILKNLAWGPKSYVSNPWNLLDTVVVIEGIISLANSHDTGLYTLRVLRILRPLRTIQMYPSLQKTVEALFNSIRALTYICLVFVIFLVMASIFAVVLFQQKMTFRCEEDFSDGNLELESHDSVGTLCGMKESSQGCGAILIDDPYSCTDGESCVDYGISPYGMIHFDDCLQAMLVVFQVTTMESWNEIMFFTQMVTTKWSSMYFVVVIAIGTYTILSLMISAILSEFQNTLEAVKQPQLEESSQTKEKHHNATGCFSWCNAQILRSTRYLQDAERFWNKYFLQMAKRHERLVSQKLVTLCETETSWLNKAVYAMLMANMLVLAMDYHGSSQTYQDVLEGLNLCFTFAFLAELLFKLMVLNPKRYFSQWQNIFDTVIVLVSIVEVGLTYGTVRMVPMVRLSRVLRLTRVSRRFESIKKATNAMAHSIHFLVPAFLLLCLLWFIFACLGMTLFGSQESHATVDPRHRFDSFFWSFLQVFLITTGDGWNIIMYRVVQETSLWSFWFFFILICFGSYLLLNLMLAIILEGSAHELNGKIRQQEIKFKLFSIQKRLQQKRCYQKWLDNVGVERRPVLRSSITKEFFSLKNVTEDAQKTSGRNEIGNVTKDAQQTSSQNNMGQMQCEMTTPTAHLAGLSDHIKNNLIKGIQPKKSSHWHFQQSNNRQLVSITEGKIKNVIQHWKAEQNKTKEKLGLPNKQKAAQPEGYAKWEMMMRPSKNPTKLNKLVVAIMDQIFGESGQIKEVRFRPQAQMLVTNIQFKRIMMAVILLSTMLAFFDPDLYSVITLDVLCTILLIFEMVAKSLANTFWTASNAYIRNGLNQLDVFLNIVAVIGLMLHVGDASPATMGTILVLNSLRPLRLAARITTMKTFVSVLVNSVQGLTATAILVLFCWFGYSIFGLQLFKGAFYYCTDPDFPEGSPRFGIQDEAGVWLSPPCSGWWENPNTGVAEYRDFDWVNTDFHFDNIFASAWSLFSVTTVENWLEIMWSAFDMTAVDHQPQTNNNKAAFLYFFVAVLLFGFFLTNLFVGVALETYNTMRATIDGVLIKAEDLRNREYAAYLATIQMKKPIPPPQQCWRKPFYGVATHPAFKRTVLSILTINFIFLISEHEGEPPGLSAAQEIANDIFAVLFFVEALFLNIGFGPKIYFSNKVYVFDFVVTVVSMADTILLSWLNSCGGSNIILFKLIRAFRVVRIIRLAKSIPGIQRVIQVAFYPATLLVNVFFLMLIICFMFANLGVAMFGDIPIENDGPLRFTNFHNLSSAMLLLFTVVTGEGWPDYVAYTTQDNAKIPSIVVCLYFFIFILTMQFLLANFFVMIVAEAYEIIGKRHSFQRLIPTYQRMWKEVVDPEGTGKKASKDQLYHLFLRLPQPLGLSQKAAFVAIDWRIQRMVQAVETDHAEWSFSEVIRSMYVLSACNPREVIPMHMKYLALVKSFKIVQIYRWLSPRVDRWKKRKNTELQK